MLYPAFVLACDIKDTDGVCRSGTCPNAIDVEARPGLMRCGPSSSRSRICECRTCVCTDDVDIGALGLNMYRLGFHKFSFSLEQLGQFKSFQEILAFEWF